MSSESDITRSLIPQYVLKVKEGDGCQGYSVKKHARDIGSLIVETESTKLLDYGCGEAYIYEQRRVQDYWRTDDITLFDPAVERYSQKPTGTYHGVICSDVLEHVPEHELDAFLDDVVGYAERFVFFSVCCREAKRILPNGMNAHCTIKPYDWWNQLVASKVPEDVLWVLQETE